MQIRKRLLGLKELLLLPLCVLSRHRGKSAGEDLYPDNSELEVERGRRNPRGSIERFVRHLWDAAKNPPTVERLLRKFTPRTEEAEAVRAREEEIHQRNIIITEHSRHRGYPVLVSQLQQIESDAYFNLRKPEAARPVNMSVEEWVGKQNGRLEVVEDLRLFYANAAFQLKKYNDKRRAENLKKAKQEQTEGGEE